ncbi:hypothetical protein [Streptosporangium sp. NPDC048865]|uniref:hypothetical protein n=1 Tax=Streptosporangium sp. NPDC048865 TaxID=3155766 RepID=UPI003438E5ED
MLAVVPAPVPVPTVTVTETVVVPTAVPAPAITLTPPQEGLDFWRDVFFGDFFGALIGVLGALVAAWFLIRRDRRVRQDEYRRDLAMEFADATESLVQQLAGGDREALSAAAQRFDTCHSRIRGLYASGREGRSGFRRAWMRATGFCRGHRTYDDFTTWLTSEAGTITLRIAPLRDAPADVGECAKKVGELISLIHEIMPDLRVIRATTMSWVEDPDDWEPNLSARTAWKRLKKEVSWISTSGSPDTPDGLSPRPPE